MTADSMPLAFDTAPAPADDDVEPQQRRAYAELLVLVGLGALLGLTYKISQLGWFEAGDDIGYWLGVAGGVMMLLLLLYPLRKYVRAFHRWGRVKFWLWVHMTLGIGGPLLVLLHCGFRAGSLNASAALYSMVIVAASGVIGRFLYVRLNRGLAAEETGLRARRYRLGIDGETATVVRLLPGINDRLDQFEHVALKAKTNAGVHWVRLLLVLPVRSWSSRLKTQLAARRALVDLAPRKGWDAKKLRRAQKKVRQDIAGFYIAVMRVALFAAWERLFALWHVAHIPFVFLLVIAGIVHVVAVHAY